VALRILSIDESFSKTYTGNLSVSAAARRNIRATATVSKAILVVPYTITSSPKRDPSIEVETKGTWRGLVSWKLTYTAEDGKLLFIQVEHHCSSFNYSCLTLPSSVLSSSTSDKCSGNMRRGSLTLEKPDLQFWHLALLEISFPCTSIPYCTKMTHFNSLNFGGQSEFVEAKLS